MRPDPEFFVHRRGALAWCVRLDFLPAGPVSAVAIDILDSSGLEGAACLCCYATPSATKAAAAAAMLRLFRQYFDAAAFAASWAAATTQAELSRDLRPAELAAAKQGLAAIAATPSAVRSINATPGLCVAVAPCRPGELWIYSTAMGRRLARHLTRTARRQGRTVRIAPTTAGRPRFQYRMYVANYAAPWDSAGPPTPLLAIAAAWAARLATPLRHGKAAATGARQKSVTAAA